MSLKEGSVIEFKDKKRVASVLCLKVDPKNVRVINESNKEFNLPINKISHITEHVLTVSKSRAELIADLNGLINRIEEIVQDIVLSDLWELLKEEPEAAYDLKQLSEIYFGSGSTSDSRSSMLRALIEDNIYFDSKGDGLFTPKPEKVVEQILLQKKIEEQKQKLRENTVRWLKDVWKGENLEEKPPGADKLVEILKEIAVMGNRSEKYNEGIGILHDADIANGNIEDNVINLLVKLGLFEEDQNLLLMEYNIPLHFSKTVLEEIPKINFDLSSEFEGRRDLRHLETITIDDEDTKDIDDAISLGYMENGFQVGIHIADAANFVQPGTLLDKEAQARSTTLYLPERKIEMLPPTISEDLCSLVEGKDRLAVSLIINFNNDFEIVNYEICESIVNVKKRLSYKEADDICNTDPVLIKLCQVTDVLREKRLQRGAIIFNLPELKIKITEDEIPPRKKIIIGKYKQNSMSQLLVSELMVQANSIIGEHLFKKKIPCIFKYQEEPSEIIDFNSNLNPAILMFRQRRFMKKSETSINPSEHHGLGLRFYSQMTSPIRRYSDLVVHRQLKSLLRTGGPFYSEEEIKELINYSENSLSVANMIQRNANRYWLTKYLSGFIGYKTPAIVLEVFDDKYMVQLTGFLTELPLFRELGLKLEVGQQIEVVIKDVQVRKGYISIRAAREQDAGTEVIGVD
jgi:exoribonuclease-2